MRPVVRVHPGPPYCSKILQNLEQILYLENWIKYQIVYKQVNNENEIEKLETKLESKVKMGNKYNFEINL